MQMIQFLAATTDSISLAQAGTLIGTVIIALLGGGVLGKKSGKVEGKAEGKAEAMLIGPQPFMVELKESFVTRREFDRLEGVVAVNATRTEGMFREAVKEMKEINAETNRSINRQGKTLAEDIKAVAQGAYAGRQKLHTTVNANAERLAKIEERADVAGEIGQMAEAIVDALEKLK